MWVVPLRSMVGDHGYIRRDVAVELPKDYAKKLIDSGQAVPDPQNGKGREKDLKAAAEKAVKNPSRPRRSGGQTGAGKRSSALAEGQAPESKTSSKSETPGQS